MEIILTRLAEFELHDIDVTALTVRVVIVALSTLGNVEWIKNYTKRRGTKFLATIGMLVLMLHVVMQFMPQVIAWAWNLLSLGNAFMQFGHVALIKVPEAMIGKTFGVKDETKPKQ